jgi:hypothetical protein
MNELRADLRPGIRLIRCSTNAELRSARQFRAHVFRERRGIEFDSLQERRRDESSHVFLLTQHGSACATARVQSFPGSGNLAEMAPDVPTFGADSEVGRIAASMHSPESAQYPLMVLVLGAMWLLRHTKHQRYLAYCHPKLVPLYRLVGAQDTGVTLAVDGRPDPYCLLLGDYETCVGAGLTQLAHAGFDRREATRSVRCKHGYGWDDSLLGESAG